MSLSKQLYIIIAIIFFIIFSGNFVISVKNMKEYLEIESLTKSQDTATSLGMSLRPLIKDKHDPEIESILKAISNSGFYKEIRLENVDFTITSDELIGAAKQLDDSNWELTSVKVDPKYGKIEKIQSDESLNEQLLKLENEKEDLGFIEEKEIQKYRFLPSKKYENGGDIPFEISALKLNKTINANAKLLIKRVIIQETRDVKFEKVPQWFIDFIPMHLEERFSEISDGWKISAKIFVSSNPGEAYSKLYEQAKNSVLYAIFAFIVSMVILFFFVQILLKPLKKIESLAKNIAQAKFGVIEPLPWTKEIKNVSIAMNDMSRKIETMIGKLTNNINNLSRKLSTDELTGLYHKNSFETDIKQMFINKGSGFVFRIKIDNLGNYAKTHTNEEVDEFLIKFSNVLKNLNEDKSLNTIPYRIYGSDFILLAKECTAQTAKNICSSLKLAFETLCDEEGLKELAHIGVIPFDDLSTIEETLQAANETYEKAKLIGPNEYYIGSKTDTSRDMNQWRDLISDIIDNSSFDIEFINDAYTLANDNNKNVVMQEAFTKAFDKEKAQIPIGTFVSLAEKYEKIISFDKAVIQKIIRIAHINSLHHKICINLSMDSICKKEFVDWLKKEISKNKNISSTLVFSLSAYSVNRDFDMFKSFCESVHEAGAEVIVKRFESKFISTENLKELNLDYIRLARDYTVNIKTDRSKKDYLESISDLANLLNIKVLAENVKDEDDKQILKEVKLYAVSI